MITGMNHITLAVKNIEVSFAFYKDILGLKPLVKWDKGAYFLAGEGVQSFWFCLNVDAQSKPAVGYTHYALSVSQENFVLLADKLIRASVKIFKENTSPGDSLYFLDPDGHKLEVHAGNWRQRMVAKQANPDAWQNVEWFNNDVN